MLTTMINNTHEHRTPQERSGAYSKHLSSKKRFLEKAYTQILMTC